MSLLEGFTQIGKIVAKGLTITSDKGSLECSDVLVGLLCAGVLAVIGGTVYLHGDKFDKWIEAYKKEKNTDTVDMDEFKKWFKNKTMKFENS